MKKISLSNRKGQRIVGVLEQPAGEMRGTAVLQHGWEATRDHQVVQAVKRACHLAGLQTVVFDTTNSYGESEGDPERATLGLLWEDLEDVVQWVQQQTWFCKPLALAGHSMGGYAVIRYTAEHVGEVDYLIPVAPVVSGKLSFAAAEAREPGLLQRWQKEGVYVSRRGESVRRRHWFQMEERLQHDLLPLAGRITVPVLCIVAAEDTSCPPPHVQQLFDHLGSADKTLHIVAGATHAFREPHEQAECTDVVRAWLQARLPKNEGR